jgi:hypothetical protein
MTQSGMVLSIVTRQPSRVRDARRSAGGALLRVDDNVIMAAPKRTSRDP